jgi:hypothetical protein
MSSNKLHHNNQGAFLAKKTTCRNPPRPGRSVVTEKPAFRSRVIKPSSELSPHTAKTPPGLSAALEF